MTILKFCKSAAFLFGACLAAMGLADWLLYGWPIGWNLGLCVLGALLLIALRNAPALAGPTTLLLLAAILGLALAMVEEPTLIGTLLALTGLAALAVAARGTCPSSLATWSMRALRFPDQVLLRPWADLWTAARWFHRHPSAEPVAFRWTILWTIPLLLGGVFLLIFAAANPIIAHWATAIWNNLATFFYSLPEWLAPGRIFFWIVVGLTTYGLLRAKRGRCQPTPVRIPPRQPPALTAPMMVIRCLLVFNIIFGLQTLLDLIYLWGGAALPHGMTYADYAHRGSYALIVAALLAALFVIITFRAGGAAERFVGARRLVYLWIAQNVLLTLAAAWRLNLYVAAYSLTRFRVAAAIWMLLVAIGLALIVWRIVTRRSNTWLLHANVLAATAILYLCALCNFNGWIAWFNVAHCRQVDTRGPQLDTAYLADLGPDALPAVRWAQDQLAANPILTDLRRTQTTLEITLSTTLTDWRGWTWRRQRLAAAMSKVEQVAKGATDPPPTSRGPVPKCAPISAASPSNRPTPLRPRRNMHQ